LLARLENVEMEVMPNTLRTKTVRGATWTGIARIGQQLVYFLSTTFLARLLPATAYGLLGMATVVIGFITIFKDLGTSAAIIQHQKLTEELTSSVFWINVLFGILAAALLLAAAPLLAIFYREPQVIGVIRVLSLSFVISGLGIVHQSLLTRQMAFNRLALIEFTSSVGAAIVGIGFAVAGAGVWSLVAVSLVNTALGTLLLWLFSPWRPQRILHWAELRSISAYSLNLSGFNIINYFSRNADNLLIGRYLGAQQLGYYSVAYNLMLYPIQNISWVLGRVLFPAFAQIQHDNVRFRQAYLRVCAVIAAITFPLMLGMLVTAKPLVSAILGLKWLPIIPLVMILAPLGMIQSIITTVGHIYMVKGRTDLMLRFGIVASALVILAFIVGLSWGIVGVAVAYAVATFLLAYPNFAIPFRLFDLPIRALMQTLWPSLMYALIMVGVVGLLQATLAYFGMTAPSALLIGSAVGGALTYLGLMFWRKPPVVQDAVRLLMQRGNPSESYTAD